MYRQIVTIEDLSPSQAVCSFSWVARISLPLLLSKRKYSSLKRKKQQDGPMQHIGPSCCFFFQNEEHAFQKSGMAHAFLLQS